MNTEPESLLVDQFLTHYFWYIGKRFAPAFSRQATPHHEPFSCINLHKYLAYFPRWDDRRRDVGHLQHTYKDKYIYMYLGSSIPTEK